MPAFVKTKEDERLWAKARGIAEESGHKEDWAYITGIFKKMKGGKPKKAKMDPSEELSIRFLLAEDVVEHEGQAKQAAGKYEDIDFKPPESVSNAAAKGLEYRQKASPSNRGGLTTEEAGKQGIGSGVQRASDLKNRKTVSPETISKMVAFFARHEKNKGVAAEHKSEPWNDKGHVAWLLWGGDAGKTWAEKVKGQMDRADEKSKEANYSMAPRFSMTPGYPVGSWKNLVDIAEAALVNPNGRIFRQHLFHLTGKNNIRRLDDAEMFEVAEWIRDRYHRGDRPMLQASMTPYEITAADLEKTASGVISEVEQFVRRQRTWFTLEGKDSRSLAFTTREHGDVGDERPGREDIREARRLAALINQHFTGMVKTTVDYVDEWTTLDIRMVRGRVAKSNAKVVEVPNTFHPVKLEPPKAKRKEYPFEGYIDFQGIKIDVENAKGSTRSGTGPEGDWSTYMHAHYGEIRGTEGVDGDKLDVYVGDNHDSSIVVVIHQHNPWDGKYDEDKVVLGCESVEEALGLYKKQYDRPGFYREGEHTAMPIGAF